MKRWIIFFAFVLLFNQAKSHTKDGKPYEFPISDYGALGDSLTVNTQAIQEAIDACYHAGGGRVIVPPGIFFTGAFELRSSVHLYLTSGALLQATDNQSDFVLPDGEETMFLINARNSEGISISGNGTIQGTGQKDMGVPRTPTDGPPGFRYFLLNFENCKNVSIRNVRFQYSEMFAISLHKCEDVVIDGVTIKNNYFRANTDGIDPGLCKNVVISNCIITAGDDGICFKQGGENITVTNCIITTPASGIKFGTSTDQSFKNIQVNNCIIYNSMVGVGMYMKDGGTIESCRFSDLSISNIEDTASINQGIVHQQVPLYIDIDKRTASSPLGTVRHIVFENISIQSDNAILLQGMKEKPLQNIVMRNIDFQVTRNFPFDKRKKPKGFADSKFLYHDDHRLTQFARKESYATIANVDGLLVENLRVYVPKKVYEKHPREPILMINTSDSDHNNVKLVINQ